MLFVLQDAPLTVAVRRFVYSEEHEKQHVLLGRALCLHQRSRIKAGFGKYKSSKITHHSRTKSYIQFFESLSLFPHLQAMLRVSVNV